MEIIAKKLAAEFKEILCYGQSSLIDPSLIKIIDKWHIFFLKQTRTFLRCRRLELQT